MLGEIALIDQEARTRRWSAGTGSYLWLCFLVFSWGCLLLVILLGDRHGILFSLELYSSLVLLGSLFVLLASIAQCLLVFFGGGFCAGCLQLCSLGGFRVGG